MGPALDAYGRGVSVTLRNPLYVLLGAVVVAFALVPVFVIGIIPFVGSIFGGVLYSVVTTPVIAAFVIGMASAALVGRDDTVDAGLDSLSEHFASLAGAYGLLFAVQMAGWFVLLVVAIFVFVFGSASLSGFEGVTSNPDVAVGAFTAGGFVLLAFVAVAIIVVVVASLFLQFIDVAIVVGGETAVSTFRASWRLLREDPLGVVGYTVLRNGTVYAIFGVVYGLYWLGTLTGDELVALALAVLGALVVTPLAGGFYYAYHAAYYHERAGGRPLGENAPPAPQPDDPTSTTGTGTDRRQTDPDADRDPLL